MTTTLHRFTDERLSAALALLIAIGGLAFANFVTPGEQGGAAEYVVCIALTAAVAAVLFGRVLPGVSDPGRASWILASAALVLGFLAYWSGVPFVLGMAAISSGTRAGRQAPVAVGALAVVLSAIACVIG